MKIKIKNKDIEVEYMDPELDVKKIKEIKKKLKEAQEEPEEEDVF